MCYHYLISSDKVQNNTVCVLSLYSLSSDKGQINTVCVISIQVHSVQTKVKRTQFVCYHYLSSLSSDSVCVCYQYLSSLSSDKDNSIVI